ncbi:MAG: ubiquinol-cytochrome c reductase iron-sulfur subunit [Geodermatophilaceae bacterium]|nr:ubiquinol-cytochrome c reductase iron-sulfur subunit [Geodermatophilaceae bacterium]
MSRYGGGGPSDDDGTQQHGGAQPVGGTPPVPGPEYTQEQLDAMSRDELIKLGGELDGVKIIYTEQPAAPGSRADERAERQVALAFTGAGLSALAFMVAFPAWPWRQELSPEFQLSALFTPVLGLTLGLSLTLLGIGIVLWAKNLMPYEVVVQDRHEGASPEIERQTTAATLMAGLEDTGIARRSLLKRSLGFASVMLGLLAAFPLVGGLIKKPGDQLFRTPWTEGMQLLSVSGTPVRPGDMRPGSLQTVFPAVEGGARSADGVAMLIRLQPDQAARYTSREGQEDYRWNDFVAFSKICTHAGCPVSLYEQDTARILCPCHQSQFDAVNDARPIFGPATRSLPQLAIEVDSDGYFVAKSDFTEPIGPGFWERST